MADVAGAVGTFLTLATSWYKEANARGTASVTFDNHYRNFNQFHEYIKDPIESLFKLDERRRNPLHFHQAVRILHLLIDLRAWMTDAGFSTAKRGTIIAVVPRNSTSVPSQAHLVRRQQRGHGHLVHPLFGLTGKEVAFITLFERIRAAYERLEDSYPLEAYDYSPDPVNPPPQSAYPYMHDPEEPSRAGPGMRGGYNSELDGESEEERPRSKDYRQGFQKKPMSDAESVDEDERDRPFVRSPNHSSSSSSYRHRPSSHYPESAAPPMPTRAPIAPSGSFHLTKRQRLREDESEGKKARERRHLRGPLEKARREVLREQSLQEEFAEEQKVRVEARRAQQQAKALRGVRLSRRPGARVIFDDMFDSGGDVKYHVPHPYLGPDDAGRDPDPDRLGRERRQREQKERRERLERERQTSSEEERLRTQQVELETERQRFEEEKQQHADDKIKWKRRRSRREGRSEEDGIKPWDQLGPLREDQRKKDELRRKEQRSEREREHQRQQSEGAQREESERVQRERREDLHVARIEEASRRRRWKDGGMAFF